MASARKKILQLIINYFYFDDLVYHPYWKWSWNIWPQNFKEIYPKIRPTLLQWQEKGYITLIEDDEYIFTVHPDKLPSKEELLKTI